MTINPFVTPNTVQIPILDDAAWVEIKEALTLADRNRLMTTEVMGNTGAALSGGEVDINVGALITTTLEVWLVDWSFADTAGRHVPVSRDAILALDPIVADAITGAITAHREAFEAKKNEPASPTTSKSKSKSPSG